MGEVASSELIAAVTFADRFEKRHGDIHPTFFAYDFFFIFLLKTCISLARRLNDIIEGHFDESMVRKMKNSTVLKNATVTYIREKKTNEQFFKDHRLRENFRTIIILF